MNDRRLNFSGAVLAVATSLGVASSCGEDLVSHGGTGDSGTSSTGSIEPCGTEESVVQPGTDVASGYLRCESGFQHRQAAVACVGLDELSGDCWEVSDRALPTDLPCEVDADCDAGFCNVLPGPWPQCRCAAPCISDDDCGDDEVCYCDGRRSTCIPAQCRTDADCVGPSQCGLLQREGDCGGWERKLACTDDGDQCRTSADCDAGVPEECVYGEPEAHRVCRTRQAICG